MGNSTSFCRFSIRDLDLPGHEGVPAFEALARALEQDGFLNHDRQIPSASGAHPRVLGSLDSVGSFFQELDGAVRAAGAQDTLAFLLDEPSREDVRGHWARLPKAGQALARIGALVLRRQDVVALKAAVERTEPDCALREDLRFLLDVPPPEPDELDVWFTQGTEPIRLDRLPSVRGAPPSITPYVSPTEAFERKVRNVVIALGVLGVIAILWELLF